MLKNKREDNLKEELDYLLTSLEENEITFSFNNFLFENHSKLLAEIFEYKFKFSNESHENEGFRNKELQIVLSFFHDTIFMEKKELNFNLAESLTSIIKFSTGILQKENYFFKISTFLMKLALIWLNENTQQETLYLYLFLLLTREIVSLKKFIVNFMSELIEDSLKLFFSKFKK